MTDPKKLAEEYAKNWAKPSPERAERDALEHAWTTGFTAALNSDEVRAMREIIAHGVLRTHQLVKQLDGSVQSELVETYSAKVLAAFAALNGGEK